MASGAVLSQKVHRPPPDGLRRDRLLKRLAGPEAAQVTVLVAAPGCGKTTLLAQAASLATGPTGWYCAEPGDGSESALAEHLIGALPDVLRARAGRCGTSVDDLLHRLDEWSGDEALLVIDDVQELAGTSAERALGRLVALSPPRLRILLGSRRRPSINLSRLEVTHGVRQLDDEDLRFRCWEVERLFRDVYGEPLPPESVATLARRTEGWAAALQLFHLATAGKTTAERRAAVTSLGGRARLIRSYLAENVLAELRPELRSFVTRTSSLGLLSGALCDTLLGTSGAQAVLLELEGAKLFTTSPDGGLSFRYHQVFQNHLEVALQDELGDGTRSWYRRSARVLEEAGYSEEALRAHACAEDWGAVAQLLDRAGATLLDERAPAWGDLIPAPLRDGDPWLTLVDARRRLWQGAVATALSGFRRAETL